MMEQKDYGKEISNEMKGKIRVDIKRMDEQLQRHFDKAWLSQKIHQEVKDWEIDCSKLVIKNFIATGAFGSVYKGVYDGKDVAVKVLDLGNETKKATLRKIFLQEISVWNKLDHPNITKFIGARRDISDVSINLGCDIEMSRNAWCLVVEYVPGGTLKSYLIKNRVKRLPFNVVIQLALDIAKGLSYLHSHKIVHRDVKTENILLDKARRIKITDFGVSRFESLNPTEMTGQTGTLGYMAPEVLSGSAYDHKCDVYSFGICLWEIYCCAMPYSDLNRLQKASAVVYENRRPEIPERCPSNLANVMKKCWDRDPKRRPEMKEVVDLLEAIARDDERHFHGPMKGCLCFLKQRGP